MSFKDEEDKHPEWTVFSIFSTNAGWNNPNVIKGLDIPQCIWSRLGWKYTVGYWRIICRDCSILISSLSGIFQSGIYTSRVENRKCGSNLKIHVPVYVIKDHRTHEDMKSQNETIILTFYLNLCSWF